MTGDPEGQRFLEGLGLSPTGVSRLLPAATRVLQGSPGVFGEDLIYVPGRIELVGKHTDYGGGGSLVMAAESGVLASAVHGPTGSLCFENLNTLEACVFRRAAKGWVSQGPRPFWALYPDVLLHRLEHDAPGSVPSGVIRFSSTLPEAAGLSSSTAFLIALTIALFKLEQGVTSQGGMWDSSLRDPWVLAQYMAAVESGRPYAFRGQAATSAPPGVGTEGGVQDQAAILLSAPKKILHLGYRPLRLLGQGEWPAGWTVAVGVSGVVARKAREVQTAFNHLAHAVEEARRHWSKEHTPLPHLGAIVTQYPELAEASESLAWAPTHLRPRIRQFAAETVRYVPNTLEHLRAGDISGAAHWIRASHAHATEALGHSVPETESLVSVALACGSPAASAFGAGFGGSVWALVPESDADRFLVEWQHAYLTLHPSRRGQAHFFVTPPGPGAP